MNIHHLTRPMNLDDAASLCDAKPFVATWQQVAAYYKELWEREARRIADETPPGCFAMVGCASLGTATGGIAGELNTWRMRVAYLLADQYEDALAGRLLLGPGEWRVYPPKRSDEEEEHT